MIKTVWLAAIFGIILFVAYGRNIGQSIVTQQLDAVGESSMNIPPPPPVVPVTQTDVIVSSAKDVVKAPQTQGEPVASDSIEPQITRAEATLFDFAGREPGWITVDDNVMGGISQSEVQVDADSGLLTFAGTVSLENNGGFASARSQPMIYDLGSFDGIALRVRGDGQAYRLRVYSEETGRDIAYTAIFETEADTWTEVTIEFSDMVPLYRGFVVNRAGPLNPEMIRSFGLMITDKQQGEFKLEVDWINAVADQQADV